MTVLLKMGRARYAWIALLPMAWVLAVTMTAGYQKIFAADPRLGFLSAAAELRGKIAGGGTAEQLASWQHLVFNNNINAVVTAAFMGFVVLIVASSARVWWLILARRREIPLREDPVVFVPAN